MSLQSVDVTTTSFGPSTNEAFIKEEKRELFVVSMFIKLDECFLIYYSYVVHYVLIRKTEKFQNDLNIDWLFCQNNLSINN